MSIYVSEKLSINYYIPVGLISMLIAVTGESEKDIWCKLTEVANTCASRLVKKKGQRHSWTTKILSGTSIPLRVDMQKQTHYETKKDIYRCEITFGKSKFERFTQDQVNEYITESILLGATDEV